MSQAQHVVITFLSTCIKIASALALRNGSNVAESMCLDPIPWR